MQIKIKNTKLFLAAIFVLCTEAFLLLSLNNRGSHHRNAQIGFSPLL